jgi:hypothetical protein
VKVNTEDVDVLWSANDMAGPGVLDIAVVHRPTGVTVKQRCEDRESAQVLTAAVLRMVDLVGDAPDPAPKSHLPGQGTTIGGRWVRQLCQWCGEILIEEDLMLVQVPVGQEGRGIPGWPVDRYVRSEGANPRVWSDAGEAFEGAKSPADVCWLDNPEIAARRVLDEETAKAEAEERARIHAMDNLLGECDVHMNTVDDHPHTMTVTHRETGMSVTSPMYGGELLTRNALLSQLNDKLKAAAEQGGEASR